MYILLTILMLLVAIFLVLVVVIQNSKGGGLAAGFASSNQIMGVRKTTDFLEKATWWSASIIAILAIVSTHYLHDGSAKPGSVLQDVPVEQKAPAAPAFPGAAEAAPEALPSEAAPADAQQAAEPAAASEAEAQ